MINININSQNDNISNNNINNNIDNLCSWMYLNVGMYVK